MFIGTRILFSLYSVEKHRKHKQFYISCYPELGTRHYLKYPSLENVSIHIVLFCRESGNPPHLVMTTMCLIKAESRSNDLYFGAGRSAHTLVSHFLSFFFSSGKYEPRKIASHCKRSFGCYYSLSFLYSCLSNWLYTHHYYV